MTEQITWGDKWPFTCPNPKCRSGYISGYPLSGKERACSRCTDGQIHITAEPLAGMLVAWTDKAQSWRRGKWEVLEWEGVCKKPIDIAPLLPAPSQLKAAGLTAWDALGLHPGYVAASDNDLGDDPIIKLEFGEIWICGKELLFLPAEKPVESKEDAEALQRDLQKYTTLLAYLEQFGEVE